MNDKARVCRECDEPLVMRPNEGAINFNRRTTCGHVCARAAKTKKQRAREQQLKERRRIGGDEFYHREAAMTVAAQKFLCGYRP